MKSLFGGKIWIVLLVLFSLTGLVILASSLSRMEFDQPSLASLDRFLSLSDPVLKKEAAAASWIRYFIIGMFVAIFLLVLGPIRPQTGKDLIRRLLRFAVFAFVAMLFLSRFNQAGPLFDGAEQDAQTQGAATEAVPQSFSPPDVSAQAEFWITSITILLLSGVAIFVFNRFIDRWLGPPKNLDEFAEIARTTLDELANVKESRNAIIRCYTRMNKAVNEHRGITRREAETPAEFAGELEHAGLPRDAVHSLTHVFERVRYGGQNVGPEEIKEAKRCLTQILKACETRS